MLQLPQVYLTLIHRIKIFQEKDRLRIMNSLNSFTSNISRLNNSLMLLKRKPKELTLQWRFSKGNSLLLPFKILNHLSLRKKRISFWQSNLAIELKLNNSRFQIESSLLSRKLRSTKVLNLYCHKLSTKSLSQQRNAQSILKIAGRCIIHSLRGNF